MRRKLRVYPTGGRFGWYTTNPARSARWTLGLTCYQDYLGSGARCVGIPATRRFDRFFDEYGGAGLRGPPLKRFELEIDASAGEVKVGQHFTTKKRRVQSSLAQPATENYVVENYLKQWPWLSLEEAMAAPDGTTVLVNGRVELHPKRPARLCSADRDQEKGRCAPLLPDIRPQDGNSLAFIAPTFVVIRDGKFTEPMVTDWRAGPAIVRDGSRSGGGSR